MTTLIKYNTNSMTDDNTKQMLH